MTVSEIVTKTIIDKLEEAEKTGRTFYWIKPFSEGAPKAPLSYEQSKEYTGINRLLLPPDEYLTYNKAIELNCHIRNGAKGKIVVFFKMIPLKDEDGEPVLDRDGNCIRQGMLRYYRIFSRSDVLDKNEQNLPSKLNFKHYSHEEQIYKQREAFDVFRQTVENYCNANRIIVETVYDGTEAYYSPSTNTIRLPDISNFNSLYEYCHTVAHELSHSTMIPLHRRKQEEKNIENEMLIGYSREELVAEISAEMLISNLGIIDDRQNKNNSLAYLQGWSRYLNNKKQEIVSAAAKAQEASDYIFGYAPVRERNIDIDRGYNRDYGEDR